MHSFLDHHFPDASAHPTPGPRPLSSQSCPCNPGCRLYQPVALRPPIKRSHPLDMSDSSLRSVSPVHLQYLANMGVNASASVSIVKDGVLWGLGCLSQPNSTIAPGYDIRAACRSYKPGTLAQQNQEQRKKLKDIVNVSGCAAFEDDIIALLSREGSIGPKALSDHLDAIRRIAWLPMGLLYCEQTK